jgi:hypothetical protein
MELLTAIFEWGRNEANSSFIRLFAACLSIPGGIWGLVLFRRWLQGRGLDRQIDDIQRRSKVLEESLQKLADRISGAPLASGNDGLRPSERQRFSQRLLGTLGLAASVILIISIAGALLSSYGPKQLAPDHTSDPNQVGLSESEINILRLRIQKCWSPPAGFANAHDLIVVVRARFSPDGSLSANPTLINRGLHPDFQIVAESALRAVQRCAPYNFMPPAKYEAWKDIEVTFDPRDSFRG